jgi:hypothetical protein
MSQPATKPTEWDQLHDQWAEKETARQDAWHYYLQLSQNVAAKQSAALRGHQEASPTPDELTLVREAKQRWEAISRELAELAERMTRNS